MKKIIPLALTTIFALGTTCAYAQENVNKAMDDFLSHQPSKYIYRSTIQYNGTNDFYGEYEFTLPKKEKKSFETLKAAFYKDMPDAYETMDKKAGSKQKKNITIGYGKTLNHNLYIGWPTNSTDDNILLLFFNDKDNDINRTVYGMVWQEKGKKTTGKIYKIKSPNPKKWKKSANSATSPQVKVERSLTHITSGDGSKIETGPNGTIITTKDGKIITPGTTVTTTTTSSNNGKVQSLVTLDGGSIKIYDDGKVSVTDRKGNESILSTGFSSSSSSEYATDPIQKFSNMRAAYLENIKEGNIDNTSMLTGLANSILDFCKKNGKDMNESEKSLCIKGLSEMQNKTPDDYIKGIFSLAIKAMSNK